jgi:hypothetical protein
MRLIDSGNGPFIGFPSKPYKNKDGEKKYAEIVAFIRNEEGEFSESTKKMQDEITALAVAEYEHRTGDNLNEGIEEDDDELPF